MSSNSLPVNAAKKSSRQISLDNVEILANLHTQFLAENALFIFVRAVICFHSFSVWDFLLYFVTGGISSLCYAQLLKKGTPVYTYVGKLRNPGEDLNADGLNAFLFHVMYATWFVQIGSIITDYVYFTYLLVPVYGFIKLWPTVIKPYFIPKVSVE
ncbi:hypothetical protein K7432_007378 [Basidiobolus ranarum]|uniref:Uncharacterized protein n=1 Tax=Basidiobolus ranarum TaxID=34480 RepID=A0ABR2WTS2_9FUNG